MAEQLPNRGGTAVAEARATEIPTVAPVGALRTADGRKANFDDIVTPHPVIGFLFRRRTLIVLLFMLALVPVAKPISWMLGVGMGLAVLAEAWRIWSAGTIHKTEELTTGGPYGFVRHPLYVGSFLHAVGFCFMSGHWWSFLLVPVIFLPLYGAAVSTEEAMLTKIYGDQYRDYMRRVPRFVPRLKKPEPGHGHFDWRQVMANKEYVNIIWVVVISSLFVYRLITG